MTGQNVNCLIIGTDETIFSNESSVRSRAIAYANGFVTFHIICKSKIRRAPEQFENVFLYSAYSFLRIFFVLRAYRVACSIVDRDGGWIISSEDPFETGLAAWLVARRKNMRFHLQIHTDVLTPYYRSTSLLHRIRYLIARFLIPRADCIRVVSKRIKGEIVASGLSRESAVAVIPIWNKLPISRTLGNQEMFTVLMASRLEKEKEVEVALLAFSKFLSKGGKGRLIIAGSGSRGVQLEKLGKKLLGDAVTFAGWQTDLSRCYEITNVFLATSRYEGWGVAAADAVFSRIPVVMTDAGLAHELVIDGKNGIVVPVGDVEAVADALLKLFLDRALYNKMRRYRFPIPYSDSFLDYVRVIQKNLIGCIAFTKS